MKVAFPQWRGFEFAAEGQLLNQLVDLSGPMGIVYERSVGFYKTFHVHARAMIVLPRGSCVMRVKAGRSETGYTIDASSLLIVPRGVRHDDEGVTSIFDTVALYPSTKLLDQVAQDETIPTATLQRLFGRCQTLPRSRWLEQLLEQYFFARVVSRRESRQTRTFLERQILVELMAPARGVRTVAAAGEASVGETSVTDRALRYIEANLFSTMSLETISSHAFTSPATLLRHFRRATGNTPYRYIKIRRLEEARSSIAAGTHSVGDVAMLVGYENFGSFSTAFKKHFGKSPSSFRPRTRVSPSRPPSHGDGA